jgi:hypothetical protein
MKLNLVLEVQFIKCYCTFGKGNLHVFNVLVPVSFSTVLQMTFMK